MGKGYVVLKIKVASQTAYHLERMAAMSHSSVGRVVDKLVRSWALSMKDSAKLPSKGKVTKKGDYTP